MTALWPIELVQISASELGIVWSDGHRSNYAVRNVRLACRCANCVDEWTREKKLKPGEVPLDIRPRKIETVGRYALGIVWSDGHDTGIYPFEALRTLCECAACKKP